MGDIREEFVWRELWGSVSDGVDFMYESGIGKVRSANGCDGVTMVRIVASVSVIIIFVIIITICLVFPCAEANRPRHCWLVKYGVCKAMVFKCVDRVVFLLVFCIGIGGFIL